ncbi:MAG: hypothetical protein C0603_05265 [Denitrovibrio sp.]|nr:MAG: hypothetical protein C0603_05265 [Denitrovibrio sp.]
MGSTKYIILALILALTCSFAANAEDFNFKCSECHDSAKEVIPAKHIKKDKFEGCFACHQDGKQIKLSKRVHEVHLADMGTGVDTCLSCHVADKEGYISIDNKNNITIEASEAAPMFTTLYTEGTLANSHKNAGLSCSDCHTTYDYDEFDNMAPKCKSCHGDYPEMAEKTKNLDYETNPHKSHFPNLACTKCHSSHGKFTDFCSEKCHKWGFDWKQKLKK